MPNTAATGGTPWLTATEPSEVIVWESDQAVRR